MIVNHVTGTGTITMLGTLGTVVEKKRVSISSFTPTLHTTDGEYTHIANITNNVTLQK
jgi:hypothetical protein